MRNAKSVKAKMCLSLIILSILAGVGCSSSEPAPSESTTQLTIQTMPTSEEISPETSAVVTPAPTEEPTPTPTPTPIPTPEPEYVEPTKDEVWYDGFVDPRSVRAEIVTNPDDVTVLVNKYYALPLDYVPDDLVATSHSMNQQLRAEAAEAWEQMYLDCLEETGQGIFLVSGYRDTNTQQYLFDRSVNLRSLAFACKKNAWPGRSEHQLGLALDITPAGYDNIMDDFDKTTVGQWICENGHKYGLIHRYKEEFVYETGYGVEGWHFRYVGVDLATYLYENHMSLEAYYGKQQVVPWDE